jgi:hypothetical protein
MRVTFVKIDRARLRKALVPPLTSGTLALAREGVRRIKQRISIPVGRDANGNVVQRSLPGEPPRKEHGQLQMHVEQKVSVKGDGIKGEVYASRPPIENLDDPEAAIRLEYGGYSHGVHIAPRPYMRPEFDLLRKEAPKEYADQLKNHLG